MLSHSQKSLLWLLCATIRTTQPVFAAKSAKTEPTPPTVKAAEKKQNVPTKKTGLTLDGAIAKALEQSPRLQAFGKARAGAAAVGIDEHVGLHLAISLGPRGGQLD